MGQGHAARSTRLFTSYTWLQRRIVDGFGWLVCHCTWALPPTARRQYYPFGCWGPSLSFAWDRRPHRADQRCAGRAKKGPASGGPGAGQVAWGWPRRSKLEARDFLYVAPAPASRQSTKMRSRAVTPAFPGASAGPGPMAPPEAQRQAKPRSGPARV